MYHKCLSFNLLEISTSGLLVLGEFLFVLDTILDCLFELLNCFTTCGYQDLPLVDLSSRFVDVLNHNSVMSDKMAPGELRQIT